MVVFRWFCFLFVLNVAAVSVKAEGLNDAENHTIGTYPASQHVQKSLMFRKALAWASRKIGVDSHYFNRREQEAVKGFSDILTKARYGLDVRHDAYGLTMHVIF